MTVNEVASSVKRHDKHGDTTGAQDKDIVARFNWYRAQKRIVGRQCSATILLLCEKIRGAS